MKLIVKNFGAIKESVIDLSKRYYFFVGYNNTGKTYLAKLIYEIFSKETLQEFCEQSTSNTSIEENTSTITLSKVLIENLLDEFSLYLKTVVIPKSLKINANSEFILEDLEVKFDFNFEEDVENVALETSVTVGINNPASSEMNKIDIFSVNKEKKSLDVKLKTLTSEDIYSKLPNDFAKEITKKGFKEFLNSIKVDVPKRLTQSILTLLVRNNETPFFLPANRIFILENADELVEQDNKRNAEFAKSISELLESKNPNIQNKLGDILARKSESNHTSQISYLISEISKLRKNKDEDFIRNGNGFYNDLIKKLEAIMGGEIVMDKAGSISNWAEKFKLSHNGNNEPIQMYLASSSINQLGTLYLYLKYWAKAEQNFLMIDEPEENLHPESQIKLINLLLEFGNLNNRVLITTHSPLLAEIINNYLVLGQLKNKSKIANDLGLVDVDLTPEDAGIYYFNGEIVTEHKVGSYGTIFSSFKEAQDKIYSTGEYLGELMFKQLNKSK